MAECYMYMYIYIMVYCIDGIYSAIMCNSVLIYYTCTCTALCYYVIRFVEATHVYVYVHVHTHKVVLVHVLYTHAHTDNIHVCKHTQFC